MGETTHPVQGQPAEVRTFGPALAQHTETFRIQCQTVLEEVVRGFLSVWTEAACLRVHLLGFELEPVQVVVSGHDTDGVGVFGSVAQK